MWGTCLRKGGRDGDTGGVILMAGRDLRLRVLCPLIYGPRWQRCPMRLGKDCRADLRWCVLLPGLCQQLSRVCRERGTTLPLCGLLESSGPPREVLLSGPNQFLSLCFTLKGVTR